VEFRAHAEEAAERHHRINRPTTDLVDHDVIDAAEVDARRTIDGGAIHLVGGDERSGGY
jgi:hypothetical protein